MNPSTSSTKGTRFLKFTIIFILLSGFCAHQKMQLPKELSMNSYNIAICPIIYNFTVGPAAAGVYPQTVETTTKEISDHIRNALEEDFTNKGITALFIPEEKLSIQQTEELFKRANKIGEIVTFTAAEQEVFKEEGFPNLILLLSGRSFSETEESYNQRIKTSCASAALITVLTLGCLIGIPTAHSVDYTYFDTVVIHRPDGRILWRDNINWGGQVYNPKTVSDIVKTLISRFLTSGAERI